MVDDDKDATVAVVNPPKVAKSSTVEGDVASLKKAAADDEEPKKKSAAVADIETSFEDPVTHPDALGRGVVAPTNTEGKVEKPSSPQLVKDVAKALGLKRANVIGFNEQTGVVVTDRGGKYQVSKNGKALRHLAGPPPPADLKMELVDARTRSVFTGTAAAINSSVHEGSSDEALLAEKAALEARLEEVNDQLEG